MKICGICGHSGETTRFRGKWWSPDDGWMFSGLCDPCAKEFLPVQPNPDDYAYDLRNQLDIDEAIKDNDLI